MKLPPKNFNFSPPSNLQELILMEWTLHKKSLHLIDNIFIGLWFFKSMRDRRRKWFIKTYIKREKRLRQKKQGKKKQKKQTKPNKTKTKTNKQ